MPNFRRAFQPGGTFFFTVVTYRRRKILTTQTARESLRQAISSVRDDRPFEIDAFVLLADHLHCIWTLPEGDSDFSERWRAIKTLFTRSFLSVDPNQDIPVINGMRNESRRGIWQRRFWEHTVRNIEEFSRLNDYIHFNPVKHGYATCPHEWPWSSFHRLVSEQRYEKKWGCSCGDSRPALPDFEEIEGVVGE